MQLRSGVAVHCFIAGLILLVAGCASTPTPNNTANTEHLLSLIGQRLHYMDDVARNKWNSGAPIEDLPRETEIIENLGKQAPAYGLDAAIARDFFRAQIEASKIIQRNRFVEWRAEKRLPFKNIPDLSDTIRPALDALTPELMKALAAALPELAKTGARTIKSRAGIIVAADAAARDEAVSPLLRLATAP
ncbi:MAG: aroQ [Betaproteobacteria bacterium]|nr:aroQ [Betaproteobacteria bacterium]